MLSQLHQSFKSQKTEKDKTQVLITAINETGIEYSDVLTLCSQFSEHQKLALIGTFAPYSPLLHQGTGYMKSLSELLNPQPTSCIMEGLKKVMYILFIFWLLPSCHGLCNQSPSLLEFSLDTSDLMSAVTGLKQNLTSIKGLKKFQTSNRCSQAEMLQFMYTDSLQEVIDPTHVNLTWKIDVLNQDPYLFYAKDLSCFYSFQPDLETTLRGLKTATTGAINQAFGGCLSFAKPQGLEPFMILESKLHIFSCYESCASKSSCQSYYFSHTDNFCRLYTNPQMPAQSLHPQLLSANVSCKPFYLREEPQIMTKSQLSPARPSCQFSILPEETLLTRCMDDYYYLSQKTKDQIDNINGYSTYISSIFSNKNKRNLNKKWPSTYDIFQFTDSRKMPLFLQKAGELFKMVSKNQNLVNNLLFKFQSKVLAARPQHLQDLSFQNHKVGSQISTKVVLPKTCQETKVLFHPQANEQTSLIFDFYFFKCNLQDLLQYIMLLAMIICFVLSCILRKCCKKTDLSGNTYQAASTSDTEHTTPSFWASLKFDAPE